MRLLRLLLASVPAAWLIMPQLAHAGVPALQITPLQYEDTLSGTVKNGHVDVANPADAPVTVDASVRGFRQQGTDGDLAFYDDADIKAAIQIDLTTFQLAPHDAVRVLFSVDPAKLPAGGVYAAIFFRTVPADNTGSASSYVSQSTNIGTLLILRNGAAGAPSGGLSSVNMPFWQFGPGLRGSVLVSNTAPSRGGLAFRPVLATRVLPWGHLAGQGTGLILPGSQRRFTLNRPGSFFGLLPVTVSDAATHTSRTAWVFACTGLSGWLLFVLLLTVLTLLIARLVRRPFRLRLRTPNRVPVLEPLVTAIAGAPQPAPEPEPHVTKIKPKPLPAPNPKVTKLIVQAEAAAPDPGTVILPELPAPARPVHKVSVKSGKPEAKPRSVSKAAHKIKVEPHDQPRSHRPHSK